MLDVHEYIDYIQTILGLIVACGVALLVFIMSSRSLNSPHPSILYSRKFTEGVIFGKLNNFRKCFSPPKLFSHTWSHVFSKIMSCHDAPQELQGV